MENKNKMDGVKPADGIGQWPDGAKKEEGEKKQLHFNKSIFIGAIVLVCFGLVLFFCL